MYELKASDPLVFFGAFALLILLGFLGNLVFSRFKFNDTVLLIGVGLLLGPVFHIVPAEAVSGAIGVIGALALILILFTGGLELKLRDLLSGVGNASALAVPGFAMTVVAVAAIVHYTLDVSWLAAFMVGGILGGTSAVVVMPTLAQMRCEKRTSTMLNLESALTDVLVVVTASTLLAVLTAGEGPGADGVARQVITLFSMSLFFGGVAGFLWLLAAPRVRDKEFGYMMTLGVAFFVFVLTEWLLQGLDVSSGGGPLAVLAFGIVLGNSQNMGENLKRRVGDAFGRGLQRFQGEISFLVRTFFFIYLGILVDLQLLKDWYTLAIGVLVFAGMVAARYLAVALAQRRFRLVGDDWILLVMMPRGLAAAVVAADAAQRLRSDAFLPAVAADKLHADSFVAIAFLVLVLSNLLTTFGGMAISARGTGAAGPRRPPGSKAQAPARAPAKRDPKPPRAPGAKAARATQVSFSSKPIGPPKTRVRDRPRPPPARAMPDLGSIPPPPMRR